MSNFIDLLSGVYHFKEKFESAFRSCHYRACPDNLDPLVKPEYDNRKRMCLKPENAYNNLRPQCARRYDGISKQRVQSCTRAQPPVLTRRNSDNEANTH